MCEAAIKNPVQNWSIGEGLRIYSWTENIYIHDTEGYKSDQYILQCYIIGEIYTSKIKSKLNKCTNKGTNGEKSLPTKTDNPHKHMVFLCSAGS